MDKIIAKLEVAANNAGGGPGDYYKGRRQGLQDAIAIVRANWPVVDDEMVEEAYSLFYRSVHTDRMRQCDAFKKALHAALQQPAAKEKGDE